MCNTKLLLLVFFWTCRVHICLTFSGYINEAMLEEGHNKCYADLPEKQQETKVQHMMFSWRDLFNNGKPIPKGMSCMYMYD